MYEACPVIGRYQFEAIRFMSENTRGGLFLPMGTGKSFVVIEWAKRMASMNVDAFPMLVLAPKIVCSSWEKEIKKFGNGLTYAYPRKGNAAQRVYEMSKAAANGTDIIICNYDIVSKFGGANPGFRTIICDESTRIKNTKASRSKYTYQLAHSCTYRWILTGTPVTRDIMDIYGQIYALDEGQRLGESLWKFLNNYCSPISYGPGKRGWVPKAGSVQRIKQRIDPISIRKERHECLSLPGKLYQEIIVPATAPIKKEVKEMIEYWTVNGIPKDNTLAIDMAIRQVCCGFLYGEETREFPCHKYDAILELVQDANEQVVIWTNFVHEQQVISQRLTEEKIDSSCIRGDIPHQKRETILDEFEAGMTQVLIISEPTGAYGLNQLRHANIVIYASNNYDLELRKQSEDRTYRAGRTVPCTYYDIVTEDSVEEHILGLLKSKHQLSQAFIRDAVLDAITSKGGRM